MLFAIFALGVASLGAERAPNAVLEFDDMATVKIHRRGALLSARVLPTSADMGWAIWLHWRELSPLSGTDLSRSGAFMLMPDQCAPGEWRQLRVWLRHKSDVALSGGRARV